MNSEKVKEKNPRGNTNCHTFLIVFLFACLFISNYCFLNHIKSANGAIKLRVQHLEKDAEITKDIIVNVSVILRDIPYVVTERSKPNVQGTDNRKRRRRNIDKAVNSNGDTQKIMEGTLYSLKREMTALNDRYYEIKVFKSFWINLNTDLFYPSLFAISLCLHKNSFFFFLSYINKLNAINCMKFIQRVFEHYDVLGRLKF